MLAEVLNNHNTQESMYTMTKAIDKAKYEVLQYVPYDLKGEERTVLEAKVTALFEELGTLNKYNFAAHLPTGEVDMGARSVNWGELQYGEDYETEQTVNYEDPFTKSWESCSTISRDKLIEQCEEKMDELDSLPKQTKKQAAEYKNWETLKDNLERADTEIEELMWNTSWAPFGDSVDTDIVDQIPQLTWVTDLREDQNYVTLSCIGQDNGPALMAYVALAHGFISPSHVRYWDSQSSREWTRHVIGTTCFMKVAETLGVKDLLEYHLDKDEKARKQAQKEAEDRKNKEAITRNTKPSKKLLAAVTKALKTAGPQAMFKHLVDGVAEDLWPEFWAYEAAFEADHNYDAARVVKALKAIK